LDRDDIYPVELEDLNTILQTYFEIVGFDKNKKYYIFLDEIQIVENREKFALKVFDQYPNVELIITGSSSKLLSKEIYT
jgi:predicted AAA+ superfamily ATPase